MTHNERLLRICVFGMWVAKLALEPIEEILGFPSHLIAESPVAVTSSCLLGYHGVRFLRWLIAVLCAMAAMRRLHRPLPILLAMGLAWFTWLQRSVSFGNHAELTILYASFAFCWEDSAGASARPKRDDWLYTQLLTLCCLGYTLCGTYRLAHGGLQWCLNGGVYDVIVLRTVEHRGWNLDGGAYLWNLRWARQAVIVGSLVAACVEVLAPLAILTRRLGRVFLVFIIGFHIAVAVLMDIYFWENMVLASALLYVNIVGDTNTSTRPIGRRTTWRVTKAR